MCVGTGERWEEAMDGGGKGRGGGASQGLQGTGGSGRVVELVADGWTPAWLLVEPVLLCVAVVHWWVQSGTL
jgi:hypothetical protein